jgi:cytidylate kinase
LPPPRHPIKISPIEKRIEKVMEKEGVNSENARWMIEKADHEMSGAIYLIYGKDWDNSAEYDRVFDTSIQPFDESHSAMPLGLFSSQFLDLNTVFQQP